MESDKATMEVPSSAAG
nr:hypothetical protein [Pandoraea oxalativorans]